MGWIVSESPRLVCPSFADVLVGSEPPQGLEALSEVVGVEEGFEVLSELLVGLVVIAPNGGFLGRIFSGSILVRGGLTVPSRSNFLLRSGSSFGSCADRRLGL